MLSVKLELEQTREERDHDKRRAETLCSDITQHQSKNQHLLKDLRKSQQEVNIISQLTLYNLVYNYA